MAEVGTAWMYVIWLCKYKIKHWLVIYYKLVYIYGPNIHQTNKHPLFGSTCTVYLLHGLAAFRTIIKECHEPIISKDGITQLYSYKVSFYFIDLSTLRDNGPERGRNK